LAHGERRGEHSGILQEFSAAQESSFISHSSPSKVPKQCGNHDKGHAAF